MSLFTLFHLHLDIMVKCYKNCFSQVELVGRVNTGTSYTLYTQQRPQGPRTWCLYWQRPSKLWNPSSRSWWYSEAVVVEGAGVIWIVSSEKVGYLKLSIEQFSLIFKWGNQHNTKTIWLIFYSIFYVYLVFFSDWSKQVKSRLFRESDPSVSNSSQPQSQPDAVPPEHPAWVQSHPAAASLTFLHGPGRGHLPPVRQAAHQLPVRHTHIWSHPPGEGRHLSRNAASLYDATCTWSGQLPPRQPQNPLYSTKI